MRGSRKLFPGVGGESESPSLNFNKQEKEAERGWLLWEDKKVIVIRLIFVPVYFFTSNILVGHLEHSGKGVSWGPPPEKFV